VGRLIGFGEREWLFVVLRPFIEKVMGDWLQLIGATGIRKSTLEKIV
jgi:hypothetical protein